MAQVLHLFCIPRVFGVMGPSANFLHPGQHKNVSISTEFQHRLKGPTLPSDGPDVWNTGDTTNIFRACLNAINTHTRGIPDISENLNEIQHILGLLKRQVMENIPKYLHIPMYNVNGYPYILP